MARRDAAKRSLATPGTVLHGFSQAARRRLRRTCRAFRVDDAVLQAAAKVSSFAISAGHQTWVEITVLMCTITERLTRCSPLDRAESPR